MDREFDIVIFGASGFVGKYAIINLQTSRDRDIKWAVAGRSKDKVLEALRFASKKLNYDITDTTAIIEADVNDYDSLVKMAERTKIVANCVGPYTLYGEPVVKACVQTSTHHLDVTGEMNWVKSMQLKYYKQAEQSGSLIISFCAFESIPMEMATQWMKDKFEQDGGTLNAVEGYSRLRAGPDGFHLNHGTWDSMLSAVGNFSKFLSCSRKVEGTLYSKPLPKFRHTIKRSWLPFKWSHTDGINIPLYDIDNVVNNDSNSFNYNFRNERPIMLSKYGTLDSFWTFLLIALWVVSVGPLTLFSWTRQLLIEYPRFFSFGLFSKEGPTEKQVEGTSFEVIVKGIGWKNKKLAADEEPSTPPDTEVVGWIMGPEPTYPGTSQCLIQSAITIVKEREKIGLKGGVVTPRVAFAKTTLIDRLSTAEKNPIKFSFLSSGN